MTEHQWITGQPCWADLSTSDVDRSVDFYRELFDWEAVRGSEDHGGYLDFIKNDLKVAGLAPRHADSRDEPSIWTTYLYSTDVAATALAINAAGGRVLQAPTHVEGLGVLGVAVDPGGAMIGAFEPVEGHGFQQRGVPGSPVWYEVQARDFAEAHGFYQRAFGWNTRSLGRASEFRYEVLVNGDDELAGLLDASRSLADGVPSTWQVYFGVVDTDATVGRALELGGRVARAPSDGPFGRMAGLVDATGAPFAILSSS